MPEPLHFKDEEHDPYAVVDGSTPRLRFVHISWTGSGGAPPRDMLINSACVAELRDWLDRWLKEQAPESPDKE